MRLPLLLTLLGSATATSKLVKGAPPATLPLPSRALTPPAAATPPPYTEVTFPLEHSLGEGGDWSPAGSFSARAYADRSGSGAVRLSHAKLERQPFSAAEKAALATLLRSDGLYRLRVPASALSPGEAASEGRFVTTFLPARCWAQAGGEAKPLSEAWVLQSDEAGNLITAELTPAGGSCPASAPAPAPVTPSAFASAVSVRLPKEAPLLSGPLLAAFNADGAEFPEAGPDPVLGASLGEVPAEPKTFFQKYGMMLTMFAFNILVSQFSGGAKKAAAGEKKGEGERPARVAAAGATAAAELS